VLNGQTPAVVNSFNAFAVNFTSGIYVGGQ
jgi:hypothetical protein